MNTKDEIKAAIEEFGDDTYQRFNSTNNIPWLCNSEILNNLDTVSLKPLPELFAHDVEVYGNDAYLMWQFENCAKKPNNWTDCTFYPFNFNNFNYRRKTSSALPFDLERTKAGDKVQYFDEIENKLIDVISLKYTELDKIFSINVIAPYINYYGLSKDSLRMKYPKKVKND